MFFLAIKALSIFYWFNLFRWLAIQPTKKPPQIDQNRKDWFAKGQVIFSEFPGLLDRNFVITISVFLKYGMKTLRKQIPGESETTNFLHLCLYGSLLAVADYEIYKRLGWLQLINFFKKRFLYNVYVLNKIFELTLGSLIWSVKIQESYAYIVS